MKLTSFSANPSLSRVFAPAYGMGSLGLAIFILTPQLLLLFFMTETLGIPPGVAGGALLFPKLWEVVSDPLIGRWSDRLDTRWGRRRPLMAIGSIMFVASFALLFAPPTFSDWRLSLIWVVGLYILTSTAYSLFTVPYVTLPAEVTDDPHIRTRIVAWRSGFLSVGFLVAGGLAPWLVGLAGGSREGYWRMSFLIALIAFAGMATSVVGTGGGRFIRRSESQSRHMLTPFRSPAFSWLWLGLVIQMISVSIATAFLPFYSKYWLGNQEGTIPTIFAGMTVLTVMTTWCWTLLSRRIGKHQAFILATILYAVATASMWLAMEGPVGLWFAIILFGVANAGQVLFCMAILPDVIAVERARTGLAEEGAFTGLWIWGEKIGLALGAGIAGLSLQLAGFQQSTDHQLVQQTPMALQAIVLMATIIPGMICALSILPLLRAKKAMASQIGAVRASANL